jgi:putative phosphoesterase
MRVALLSDIHGNALALDAVLADIEKLGGVDAYWVLGDLAAIGYDPLGCLERLTALPNVEIIRGNTDRYLVTGERPHPSLEQCEANPALWPIRAEVAASFAWTQGVLTASGWLDWLAELPLDKRFQLPDGQRVLCVHASPGNDDGPGFTPETSRDTLAIYLAEGQADLLCVGHTHWPQIVELDSGRIVNLGSVSNAFAPDIRASYLFLTADKNGYQLEHRRVDYDHQAVIAELKRVRYPAADYIISFMRGEHFPPWVRNA